MKLAHVDLSKISIFLLNEAERFQITGVKDPDEIISKLLETFPDAKIVLTPGSDGAIYADNTQKHFQPIFEVQAIDTTAARDTFTGCFLAGLSDGMAIPEIMRRCAMASAIAVTRAGAIPSIPRRAEVEALLD